MQVTIHTFGDPCPYTKKYLEVTYHCEGSTGRIMLGGKGKGPGLFRTARGLTVSSTNEIFVTDVRNKRIQVFSMEGVFLRSFPTEDLEPQDISADRNDSLWVVLHGRYRKFLYENAVIQYSKEGHVLAKFQCNGRFRLHGIAMDKLSDKIILTIARYSGTFELPIYPTVGMIPHAEAVWFSPTHALTEQETRTCNMSRFGSTEEGQMPQSVTVDKKGNIFIADMVTHRVLKYNKNGVYLSSFGSRGAGAGNLHHPSGICVDSLGRIIVADSWNSRLEMFTAEGDHVCTVAKIKSPQHVAAGGEGQLVVSKVYDFVTIFPK
ncbi:TRIM3 [Branchiostoma lanceolatum]|uniref:TRIM3 protein n=1 Tax=Branchiostoma lanceolatum TaxID=7740 RepID=A0A8J9Z8C0_BRALA|nr:TRIM3 [Branchiostoma lanceolatum]